MLELDVRDMIVRAVYSGLTLYMLLILLRWVAPWLQLDLHSRRLRWMFQLTDPLIDALRRVLPPMGPMDFGPIAALFVVWIVRTLSVGFLSRAVAM